MNLSSTTAVVYHNPELCSYGATAPFSPGEQYPEYPFHDAGEVNPAYAAVRDLLQLSGLDAANAGTPAWNPFRELIRPGNIVAIKPNLVMHRHGMDGPLECVITHASLIRAVVDYVLIALKGSGSVIIGDAPLQSGNFDKIRVLSGLDDVIDYYRRNSSVRVQLADLRCEYALTDGRGSKVGVLGGSGDPRGYAVVDFGKRSMLAPTGDKSDRYRVTNYDPARMTLHHNARKHEYLVSGSILSADVVISMPKMKTHRKAGITGALKNCVGINGHKDWLPHHTRGSREQGGDEYQHRSLLKAAACSLTEKNDVTSSGASRQVLRVGTSMLHYAGKVMGKDPYFEGSWWGNDTIWRTVLDLNRALLYADRDGVLHSEPQRRVLYVVDGIVAGEAEGPIEPDPRPVGLLIGGLSAPVVDAAMARIMGFDYRKIPTVREAFRIADLPLVNGTPDEIRIVSNSEELQGLSLTGDGRDFGFRPTKGWQGHIELERSVSHTSAA